MLVLGKRRLAANKIVVKALLVFLKKDELLNVVTQAAMHHAQNAQVVHLVFHEH